MKFYDISRELFGSAVYPGDPAPECERLMQVRNGDGCNLTYLKCVHTTEPIWMPPGIFWMRAGRLMSCR